MSSAHHNRIIKTENKPFCGTCKNAGRPYSEYTSHFTKSVPGPHGIVTCPLILSSVCGNCQQRGHFTNFCSNPFAPPSTDSVPSSNSRWQKPESNNVSAPSWKKLPSVTDQSSKRVKLNSSVSIASSNVFDALNDDKVAVKVVSLPSDEFPALAPVQKALPKTWVTDHKFDPTVALKTPTIRAEPVLRVPVLQKATKYYFSEEEDVAPSVMPVWSGQKALTGSWADYEEDEDY